MMSQGGSSDHHLQRYEHRGERESNLDRPNHHHRVERDDRVHYHRVEREVSVDRSHHQQRVERESSHHRKEREITPERPRRSHHHRRTTESPSPIRHLKRRSEPPRDVEPVRRKRTTEDTAVKDSDAATAAALEADRKQKASVFSRISFPEEKKRKGTSESCSHDVTSNGYKKDPTANGNKGGVEDQDSSDDERHFKRRPSRYEPSPPPPIEWEEDVRPSRDRGHNKHR